MFVALGAIAAGEGLACEPGNVPLSPAERRAERLSADYAKALELENKGRVKAAASAYRRAAEQGHGPAAKRLGDLYAEGRGVPKDDRKARSWHERARARAQTAEAMRCR